MVLDGRGPNSGWQEDSSEGSSSSRSNDVPANQQNYPNDPCLTGSSSHGPRPQGSGPTIPFHTQNPSLFSHNQYGYHLTPQSGPTSSNQLPRNFQIGFTQTWPNNQVTDTRTPTDMTRYYHSPQYTSGDASVGNARHHSSSPFYPIDPPNSTMVQPAGHQHVMQYSGDRRPSFNASTPYQPTDYASLPSPSRPDSSYSHTRTSPQRLEQQMPLPMIPQWPPSIGQSSRSTSDSTPVTHPHSNLDPQSPVYPSDVTLSGNSSQASHLASLAQLPSYFGETSSYPPYPPNNSPNDGPNDGPSFPVPQPAPRPAPAKGRRARRSYPYPQSDRQTRKVSRSDEPVASGSAITLDMVSPQAARGRRREPQTEAQKKDAERKIDYRANLKCWFDRIAGLLRSPQPDLKTRLQILIRVIERLGGTPPEPVNHPKKISPGKEWNEKSLANAIRAHNEDRAYDTIRELLLATGRFNISSTTSHLNLLLIVVYVLSEMVNGVVDEDLTNLIHKFLNLPGYGTL